MGLTKDQWQKVKGIFAEAAGYEPPHRQHDFVNLQRDLKRLGINDADTVIRLWRRFVLGLPRRVLVAGGYEARRPFDAFRSDLGRLLALEKRASGSAGAPQMQKSDQGQSRQVAPRHVPEGL